MNLASTIGRRRFTLIYLGMLLLKSVGVIAAIIFVGLLKIPAFYLLPTAFFIWTAFDFSLFSVYAARLRDVDLPRFCLWVLYLRHAYLPIAIYFFVDIFQSDKNNNQLLSAHPIAFSLIGAFAAIWMIANCMILYLFFKKGENHERP